jgi:hypothetical protein
MAIQNGKSRLLLEEGDEEVTLGSIQQRLRLHGFSQTEGVNSLPHSILLLPFRTVQNKQSLCSSKATWRTPPNIRSSTTPQKVKLHLALLS